MFDFLISGFVCVDNTALIGYANTKENACIITNLDISEYVRDCVDVVSPSKQDYIRGKRYHNIYVLSDVHHSTIENVITGWAGVSGSPKNRVGQLIINEVKDARAKN